MADSMLFQYDDYAQSANTLFHFMTKSDYLKAILRNRAIVPRYCMENIEYLNLCPSGMKFKEVAVLQKCFCDIPFHKLTEAFALNGVGEVYESLSEAERLKMRASNTHPEYYGKFAIAFSKSWGEEHDLQPIHYLNEKSTYSNGFSQLFDFAWNADDIADEFSGDVISRLSLIKPLRGIMKRTIKRDTGENVSVEFYKNFHDEKEWRYVPGVTMLSAVKMASVIANPNINSQQEFIANINTSLSTEKYKTLWLTYNYDDVRYIIVPDTYSRIEIIKTIMDLPDEKSEDSEQSLLGKYILISKILVLDEIRGDW